ncbi:MAG: ATPase, T2SS/T4P/T4SS family [Candidatus Avoscillospira sp.]
MKQMEQILPLLPDCYAESLRRLSWEGLEEIRLGTGRPLRLLRAGREEELRPLGDAPMLEDLLRRACRQSVYACADSLRQGYLTVEGGHRIGICGAGVMERGVLQNLSMPSSVVIRIAHEIPGCANDLLPKLRGSTLLLGPPGSGKTTLLRDAVRLLSDRRRQRMGLADQRGEVSAMVSGVPQLQVGSRTDVLVRVDKAAAVLMLLRTMNPQWIAMDEITAPEDAAALEQAAYCGVNLLATAHGSGLEDLKRRPLYRRLLDGGVFETVAVLRADKSYTVEELS